MLFPDWATVKFHQGGPLEIENFAGQRVSDTNFIAGGPQAQGAWIKFGTLRQWGAMMQPAGWTQFIRLPAVDFVNGLFDGHTHPVFEQFRPLADLIFKDKPNLDAEAKRLDQFFLEILDEPQPEEELVREVFFCALDPQIRNVTDFADSLGISRRQLERVCKRHMGFTPKFLLRRQRFRRSLSHFFSDPTLRWIGAIDDSYHDQAQFVRDFKQFMGMRPKEFAALDKPLQTVGMRDRDKYVRKLVGQVRARGETRDFGVGS